MPDPVESARRAFAERDWARAHALLRAADESGSLDPESLEMLSCTARWSGLPDAIIAPLERAFAAHCARGGSHAAGRVALALCQANDDAAQPSVAAGWLGRAQELLEGEAECEEHARVAWLLGRLHGDRGELAAHEAAARRAHEIARRVGSPAVEALALVDLGHVAAARGRTVEAIGLMGQALALAVTGQIPILEAGLVYCQAVSSCRSQGEWSRACEWTETIDRWIDREGVEYFPGLCRIHRSEVTRHRGSLAQAESEALEAVRLLGASIPRWLGLAHAELGEVRRRKGDLEGALQAFRAAMEHGWTPQPGLALLVLEQGDAAEAHRSLERFCAGPMSTWIAEDRANLGKARVGAAVAAGALDAAELALEALHAQAASSGTAWDRAAAHTAAGELALARGEASAAIGALQEARRLLAEEDAPFELASAGVLLGRALAADGDAITSRLELEAARAVFERIGARRAAERVAGLLEAGGRAFARGGSARADEGAQPPVARFVREGDVWTLAVGASAVRLKDGRGLRYVAELLARPGEEILAADLVSRVAGAGAGAIPPSDAGPMLDDKARRAYERRVYDLRETIALAEERGDVDAVEVARQELEVIARELGQAIGLGGRHRRASSSNERARQSVTKAIRGAIRRVAQLDPGLGRMLESSIRTGSCCSYVPDPRQALRWQL